MSCYLTLIELKAKKDQAKFFDLDCINHCREPLECKSDTSFCAFWTFSALICGKENMQRFLLKRHTRL